MAGRVNLNNLCRRASRSTAVVTLIALSLALGSGLTLSRAAAEHFSPGAAKTALTALAAAPSAGAFVNLAGRELQVDESTGSVVVGEFEGQYDAATRSFSVRPRADRVGGAGRGRNLSSRSNPSSEVPLGANGFLFNVVASTFIGSGDNPGTVSGETQLMNNTTVTLYNTRIVFTAFKLQSKTGPDAGNLPGQSGFAYFNDGLIAFNNKLGVSRLYGDIPAGGNVKNIWTFATVAQPPGFFFAYKVLADLGVAAESVQPAAVQVGPSTGTSVVINGRGFNSPTVQLLDGSNNVVGSLTVSGATATQATATVPAGTAAGIYSVRVTNSGGTPGGAGSSTLVRKLTVTGAPDGAHTISGAISSLPDTGPYLISGSATIGSALTVPAGSVFYIAGGAAITIAGGGNLVANGGVPGVTSGAGVANPAQIVLTAQRAAGAALPTSGAWAGVNATAASTAELVMRNTVVEYAGNPGVSITGSGRKLRLTDSIVRNSSGAGVAAGGVNDALIGFSRNQINTNGSSATDPAILLSANAALGLYELADSSIPTATSVGDASYFYSSANDFNGNQSNAIQIGTDADAASNDFTKSGVLVGQGSTPLQIRGSSSNPAIVGAVAPAPGAELAITPGALIQLAPGTDFQAGDYPSNKVGCIAANGYAGFYLGTQAAMSNKYIDFDKIPGGGNFGAIFFARNAMANCILNFVRVQNGGASSLGSGEVIVEGRNLKVTNSQINNSSTGGLIETLGASVNTKGTTFSGNSLIIDTIAGGVLGDGNIGLQANFVTPAAIAVDPQGRGVYIVDSPAGVSYLRFLNTSRNTITLGGQKIPGGALRNVAGGGLDPGENVSGKVADIGIVTGVAVNPAGDVVYFIDSGAPFIRAVNVSNAAKTIAGASIGAGNVGTFATNGFGSSLNGLAVNPTNGDLYAADATAGVNKIFKLPANVANISVAPTGVAGNSASTKSDDSFSAGAATNLPLLQPRAIVLDGSNNLYVADTGHARVIKVDTGGNATMVAQFPPKPDGSATPYQSNPFTSGLSFFNGKLYIANGNAQDIARIDSAGNPATLGAIAGTIAAACDYSSSTCGDGGLAKDASFSMLGSTGSPPLASIAADSKGLFICDQGSIQRGRIRYINFSASKVEVAGVSIEASNIDTVAGTGRSAPFDGGLATSASFNSPLGVSVDPNGNLWVADTLNSKLRFINRGATQITIFPGTASVQDVPAGSIVTVNRDVGAGATDGVPAIQAGFDTLQGIVVTAQGVYIADSKKGPPTSGGSARRTGLIRFINTTSQIVTFYSSGATKIDIPAGNISTIAGGSNDSNLANVGDGPNPLNSKFLGPSDIALASNGDMFIADPGQRRVRKIVRATGVISSLTLPTTSPNEYTGVSFDSQGRLLVANAGNKQILREKTPGSGSAANGFDTILSGDPLNRPRDVVEGKDGALYVTNAGDVSPASAADNRIIKVVVSGSTGTGSVLLGSTAGGYSGDGSPIANAQISITPQPINVATVGSPVNVRTTVSIIVSPNGELIFADAGNNAIRRIR